MLQYLETTKLRNRLVNANLWPTCKSNMGSVKRQAFAVLQFSQASYRHQFVTRDLSILSREITLKRLRYGYRRVNVQLQREGWRDNPRLVYRLYREGLSLRLKRPKRNKAANPNIPRAWTFSQTPCLTIGIFVCWRLLIYSPGNAMVSLLRESEESRCSVSPDGNRTLSR